MALEIADRVKETTTTTSTGTYTLAGAVDGFQSFAAVGDGNTTYYACTDGTDYEVGVGSYTASGTTLSRVTILESSNSDAAVNWGAGTKEIFVTVPAEKYLVRDASGNVSLTGNLAVSGTVDGRDVAADGSKLDGIESGATADQTAAEIRAKVEAASDSNVFTDADHTKLNGIEANAKDDQTITAGSGLTGGGTGDVTLSHADTSSQASVNGSGRTYIQDITLDTYGHVTGLATATETVVNTDTVPNNATITISAGNALTGGGNFTTDQASNETITINHQDTSSQASVNNSGRTYIQDITLDSYGHVTGISSATETVTNTNTNQLTTFQVEDGDGTEVTISHGKEWKFVEGTSIDINWTNTSNGSDADPYDLTISHADTSTLSGTYGSTGDGTKIDQITVDAQGHVTAITTGTTGDIQGVTAGSGLTGGGTSGTVTISHADTSSQASVNNSGRTYIQDITLDTYGHITGITSATETVTNTNTNQLTTFQLEDGDGTEVTISHGKEVKFVEGGGIDINWTDTSTGSDGDPYDLTFTHADTSSQGSVNNSNGTVIQDVTLDGYGHVTALGSVNLDNRYIVKGTGYTWTAVGGNALSFRSNDTIDTASGDQASLEVLQDTAGADAFMQFHVAGDYAKYFGLHGGINDFVVGGWSYGAGYQRIFHDGYHPNADKWTTSRTLSLSGDASGSVSWDGSGNATLSVAVSNDSHTHDGRYYTETESDSRYARKDTATRQDFTGSIRVSSNNTTGGGIVLADDGDIVDLNDGYASMRFSQGVRVYSTNAGGSVRHTLHSDGTFTATGNINSSSDVRLKDNVEEIEDALTKIGAIRGVTYNRNDIQGNPRQAGVIAQEVEKVLPEVVWTGDDGYKSVAYGNMVGLLIEAIKEQQTQIDAMTAQIEKLKRQ